MKFRIFREMSQKCQRNVGKLKEFKSYLLDLMIFLRIFPHFFLNVIFQDIKSIILLIR